MEVVTAEMPVKSERLDEPYVAAGSRLYVIGAQDGGFPDMGWHVLGEMGGVWAHPVKLLDGFWLEVDGEWLTGAREFVTGAMGTRHEFSRGDGLTVSRREFVPDDLPALVVTYRFHSSHPRRVRLRVLARSDMQPVWGGSRVRGRDGATYRDDLGAWACAAPDESVWALIAVDGMDARPGAWGPELWGPERCAGDGVSVTLEGSIDLGPDRPTDVHLTVVGGTEPVDDLVGVLRDVRARPGELEDRKARRVKAMADRSELDVLDGTLDRCWDWLKYNNDWLVRTVPGLGRGLGAGLADYPWWFGCDNGFALLGCLALGQHEIAVDTLDLLRLLSIRAHGDIGRIIHECTTLGTTANPGCAQETPQFVTTVWRAYQWTGDLWFLARNYDFCRRGLLDWTLRDLGAGEDPLPRGYGIMEVENFNLQCVDTATHTVTALRALAGMAQVMGDADVEERCLSLARIALARLEDLFWIGQEGLYGDIVGSPRDMAPRLELWLEWARAHPSSVSLNSVPDLERLLGQAYSDANPDVPRAWLLRNWTVVAPLEAGLADPGRAQRALERIETAEFSHPLGLYTNAMRGEQVMSINTGCLAMAELQYGRADPALGHLLAIAGTLDVAMPGALSEIAPDQGCFVQAWSGYSLAWPIVAGMFGLRPDAAERRLFVDPCFPTSWAQATLSNVRIGAAEFDFAWDGRAMTVNARSPDWTVLASRAGAPVRRSDGGEVVVVGGQAERVGGGVGTWTPGH